ncbi:MAG: hypothetical protein KJ737_08950 [Proteobacteria bacterium]|nr:hypothetical protein [Pseudomonadota bacterium]
MGLPEDEAINVFDKRVYREAVDADWQRSAAMDIQVIPTYVAGERRLAGFQSVEALKGLVRPS